MENAQIIIKFLLEVLAFIAAIGAAWTYIRKWNAESKGTKNGEVIKEHSEELKKLSERVTILEGNNRKQDSFISAMCGAMLALLEHNINGNSIDKLKEAKEEMQEFLIHRG